MTEFGEPCKNIYRYDILIYGRNVNKLARSNLAFDILFGSKQYNNTFVQTGKKTNINDAYNEITLLLIKVQTTVEQAKQEEEKECKGKRRSDYMMQELEQGKFADLMMEDSSSGYNSTSAVSTAESTGKGNLLITRSSRTWGVRKTTREGGGLSPCR